MTTTKEPETAVATAANGSADAVKAAAHAGEGDGDQELDPASEEPEEIPIRVDPLQQQNASPVDIDKGLRLIQLCRDGSLLAVKSHISEGSPAGFISKTGWTPLAAAAYSGKADVSLVAPCFAAIVVCVVCNLLVSMAYLNCRSSHTCSRLAPI